MRIICLFLLLSALRLSAQDTYYISAAGNDANTGTSPSAPWKTIPYMQPGKTYLLNRGDTLSFSIGATANTNPANKIRLSSYGSGAKPVLSLYKKIKASAWTQHASGIWKANIASSANFTGLNSTDANVGFIKVGSKIYGNKLTSVAALSSAWDFFSDQGFLYVYSSSNPAGAVQAAVNVSAVNVSDNMEVEGISICGSGAHGISAYERSNVTLRGVDITEIGGSFLPGYGDGTTRYGNGIEFFNKASSCLIENCSVSQVYDVAFTMQGTGTFTNVVFQNNTADKNEQTFETWLGSGSEGFRQCRFTGNQCSNAGLGWSHAVRPNKDIGVHILTYLWQVNDAKSQDLVIESNTFSKAKSGLWYWGIWDAAPPAISKNNIVTLDGDTPIRSLVSNYTVKNSADFVSATGLEKGTIFNGSKSSQTITFEALPPVTTNQAPFTLQASASSNLNVSFSIVSGPATLSGTTLTVTGAGTVSVKADQPGNQYYNAAPSVTQNFTVTAASTGGSSSAAGTILLEQWLNISGTSISDIPVNSSPSTSTQLTSFKAPSNTADNYGSRIRGYVTPSVSGTYYFYVAGDDKAELWLSPDDNPVTKVRIAYTDQWTNEDEYTKYSTQKSPAITLTAGKKYYIEALQKEGPGGDNLSVQWQLPSGATESPLPGKYLSPFSSGAQTAPTQPVTTTGSILLEEWMDAPGNSISDIPLSKTPTTTVSITAFEAPSNFADNYGSRIRGYVTPPVSGNYVFWIAADDTGELRLSTDENPSNKALIAYTSQWTNVREYNRYASQRSAPIPMVAGKRYYIEGLQKEGPGGDNFSVQWQLPDGSVQTPLPGQYLSPYSSSQARIAAPDVYSNPLAQAASRQLESHEQDLNVFPNPASGQVTVQFTAQNPGLVLLSLYSLSGELIQKIFSGPVSAFTQSSVIVKTDAMSTGTYILKMVNGKEIRTKKILIIKP